MKFIFMSLLRKFFWLDLKMKNLETLIGKTLVEIATDRNKTPRETVVDLIYEDNSRIQVVYFSMSEDNIKKKLANIRVLCRGVWLEDLDEKGKKNNGMLNEYFQSFFTYCPAYCASPYYWIWVFRIGRTNI